MFIGVVVAVFATSFTHIGRKKEKHVKNTVLMSLLSVAGLAASANAQYSFQGALVLDNDPRLAAIGVNYGTTALLPGPGATAVGITLLIRVTSQGTTPNLGLGAFQGGGSSSAPNSIFYHNDSVSDQTTALWTSAANALSRGLISGTGSNRGLLSYGSGPAAVNFRNFVGLANPNRNTPGTNGFVSAATNNNQPTNNGFNNYASAGTNAGNANGWVGIPTFGDFDGTRPATAANSYPSAPGSAVILSVTANRNPVTPALDGDGNPLPSFTNFAGGGLANAIAGSDQDPDVAGVQSVWYGVYHFVFTPRTNLGDLDRQVTVFGSGFALATRDAGFAGGTWTAVNSPTNIAVSIPSITFQVPTPGAMALLGLGGLVAGRRRR